MRALQGVSMQVAPGEVFGLLGPNGAGKSTLVKIIMTVIRPTRVQGTVLGNRVGHKPTLARVGYLPENHRFPRYLTGRQVVDFFARLQKVPRRERHRRTDMLLDRVGMTAWADKKISQYSKGMAQRVGLAQAMVADADLILLDEPTDGVDPVARREIRDVLAELRDRGKTVFINSHLLSDLELICDRVAIMVGGRVHTQGTLAEFALNRQWYEVETTTQLPEHIAKLAGPEAEVRGNLIVLRTGDPLAVQPLVDALRQANLPVSRVQLRRPSLEDLFIEAVGESDGAAGARLGK